MTVIVKVTCTHGDFHSDHQTVVSDQALNKVGFDFNPSGSDDVRAIKAMSAALIELMRPIADGDDPAKAEVAAEAIKDLWKVSMVAVKAQFAK